MRMFVFDKLEMTGEEMVVLVVYIGVLTWNLRGRIICCLDVDPGLKEAIF
jgi:hypothetical protein